MKGPYFTYPDGPVATCQLYPTREPGSVLAHANITLRPGIHLAGLRVEQYRDRIFVSYPILKRVPIVTITDAALRQAVERCILTAWRRSQDSAPVQCAAPGVPAWETTQVRD